jgi:hypothetical protein
MPAGYTIDLERSLVLSRGWGVLTDRELLAHVRALTADPRFAQNFCQLGDLRDVTDVQITAATIREMVRLNPFWAGARRALVVTSDVVFGMARMYQIRDESPDELEIFRKWMAPFSGLESTTESGIASALSKVSPIPGLD